MLYRDFATQEAIDREYDPMRGRDPAELLAGWQSRSEVVREQGRVACDVAYGPTLAERMDIYHAARDDAPIHLFFHGGYWRSLGHREFGFVAEGLVAAGISVAVVNYALCPTVAFGELVRQARAAVAWVRSNGATLGVDASRLSVSGHSAGGHLAAMLLATDWAGEYGLPDDLIGGALCVSGLYDLRPFPWSWLQPKLQLTSRDVADYSPLFLPYRVPAPVQLVAGGEESAEFARQMQAHAEHLEAHGAAVSHELMPGDDHFSILDHYAPGGRFVQRIAAFHSI
ncbi:alpha/beta hydrolase [Halomonas sp. MCCC 1A17488]|uniref:Alpha/beta hydrolase n=1 Tax=Billgrantia sulfidoxydans TaxID=2733484 RepID=A0ABX7W7Z7_9GAMM|nr:MULTISPECIES: alpha/beta hydrolase [Halomonas]MCE8018150.1 alpha/beta hydrolase [Halomonas sp. MCCC 1A17488]MCG3241483.1 alpha/beta hydrolase [Halomonas sp. MCCC 1A17488]QPP48559.1 alpha/beta hydrolase [Halomonas sp. SS10-MC5]QTP55905.1 alpha/beta hydrolase [Halomonas sulfidoxydans]